MIRVWEYDVAEAAMADVERVYGADGAWARLFATTDGFEGTELFVSLSSPGHYLSVDRFRDDASWHRFLAEQRAAYAALDAETSALTLAERELIGPDVTAVVSVDADPEA